MAVKGRRRRKKINWAVTPVRKPLAVGAALFVALIVLIHALRGIDIPSGMADVLKVLVYVGVGGYVASSTIEHKQWGMNDTHEEDVNNETMD